MTVFAQFAWNRNGDFLTIEQCRLEPDRQSVFAFRDGGDDAIATAFAGV